MSALAHYQNTVVDNLGTIRPNVTVTVFEAFTGIEVNTFKDRNGDIPQDSPFVTGEDAQISFYVPAGTYRIQMEFNGHTAVLNDVAITTELALSNLIQGTSVRQFTSFARTVPIFKLDNLELKATVPFSVTNGGAIFAPIEDDVIVTLPPLLAGDYLIYMGADGTFSVVGYDTAPDTGALLIGGYSVSHITKELIQKSLWDVDFHPTCNPRAMTYIPACDTWIDIYPVGDSYLVDGYSKFDDPVDVTTGWLNANKALYAHDKCLPPIVCYSSAAIGTEDSTQITPTLSTGYIQNRQGDSGANQISGCFYQWTSDGFGFGLVGSASFTQPDLNLVNTTIAYRGSSATLR